MLILEYATFRDESNYKYKKYYIITPDNDFMTHFWR